MEKSNESLAELGVRMLKSMNPKDENHKDSKTLQDHFMERFKAVGKPAGNAAKALAILPDSVKGLDHASQKIQNSTLNKVEMQRLVRNKKTPEANSKVQNTQKPVPSKLKRSIWDIVKAKRKAKGDSVADKIKKQREARDSTPKKKVITDPKKVKSRPYRN